MSKPRSKWWFLAISALATALIYALWPAPIRPAILYAYSDNAFGMWGLTLFKDGLFDITLPGAQGSGRFKLLADTVKLLYSKPIDGLPSAYLIDRNNKKIEELHHIAGKWTVADHINWAELQYDSTQAYAR